MSFNVNIQEKGKLRSDLYKNEGNMDLSKKTPKQRKETTTIRKAQLEPSRLGLNFLFGFSADPHGSLAPS